MCLETLLLLEREVAEEGRGESLAAWSVCSYWEKHSRAGQQAPGALRGGVGALGWAVFYEKGCWRSWGVVVVGWSCWENERAYILL